MRPDRLLQEARKLPTHGLSLAGSRSWQAIMVTMADTAFGYHASTHRERGAEHVREFDSSSKDERKKNNYAVT